MEMKNVWNRINDRLDIAEKVSELEGRAIKMLQNRQSKGGKNRKEHQ